MVESDSLRSSYDLHIHFPFIGLVQELQPHQPYKNRHQTPHQKLLEKSANSQIQLGGAPIATLQKPQILHTEYTGDLKK
jgi:hypothetical protein